VGINKMPLRFAGGASWLNCAHLKPILMELQIRTRRSPVLPVNWSGRPPSHRDRVNEDFTTRAPLAGTASDEILASIKRFLLHGIRNHRHHGASKR